MCLEFYDERKVYSMAFSTGVGVGAASLISYGVTHALSWELSCSLNLGPLGYTIGRVMQVIFPILCLSQLAFSSAANASPFAAIGGIVPGLVIGALVNNLVSYLRHGVFMTPGSQMELMYYTTGGK
jgi:hypothetical protein